MNTTERVGWRKEGIVDDLCTLRLIADTPNAFGFCTLRLHACLPRSLHR